MTAEVAPRDYSLTGLDGRSAVAKGLASAKWYRCPVPRARLKELMTRSDGPAIRDTAVWIAAFVVTGAGGYLTWGTWWAVPFFAAYGVLYGSSSDSRWHECGHRTAFKTRWMNDAVYWAASFMMLRDPTVWRESHARHHVDTIIVGRDPEITAPRPVSISRILLGFVGITHARDYFRKLAAHALGRIDPEVATFVRAADHRKIFWTARLHVAIYLGVIAWAIMIGSILPLMYVGLPSFYGAWLFRATSLTQHAGLAEDVLDHRLNTHTVYMNPIVRFLYWNMNYHIEHHMYPNGDYLAAAQHHHHPHAVKARVRGARVDAE